MIKYLFICYLLNAFGIDHKQRPIGFLFIMEKLSKIIVKIREMEQWSIELITWFCPTKVMFTSINNDLEHRNRGQLGGQGCQLFINPKNWILLFLILNSFKNMNMSYSLVNKLWSDRVIRYCWYIGWKTCICTIFSHYYCISRTNNTLYKILHNKIKIISENV